MTLKLRFSIFFIANTVMVLGLFSATYFIVERRQISGELREAQIKTSEKLASVCRVIYMTSSAIVAFNYIDVLKQDPSVLYAACLDKEGKVHAHSDSRLLGSQWNDTQDMRMLRTETTQERVLTDENGRQALRWYTPVAIGNTLSGLAIVAYNREILNAQTQDRLRSTIRQPMLVAGATFVLSIAISLVLAWSLSRPIGKLTEASRAIGQGNLDYESPIAGRSDELGILAREMNAMAQKLKQLDELKDEFISHVSHDLRNPMAAMVMYAEYILDQEDDRAKMSPKQREVLSLLKDNAARLNLFVNNILNTAKIKAGRMEYHPQAVSVETVFNNVASLFSILSKNGNIELRVDAGPYLPQVHADPELLEHVVMNLVSNALKFTGPGGRVILSAAARPDSQMDIRVSDTGKGISPDGIPHLFQRFSQIDTKDQREKKISGTGLGLYIVKQMVDGMRGSIAVESELGRGTTFRVTLPLCVKTQHEREHTAR